MPDLNARDLVFVGIGPLNLSLRGGVLTGLGGPSGAGKSRLMRALADLDPHAGEVWLGEIEQSAVAAPEWRRRVGLLPAEPRFWLATGVDHLAAGPDLEPWSQALGLGPDLLSRPIKRLSSGERQRLGLLRLLLLQPAALLLDEPTANLDAANARAVETLVSDYARSRAAPVLWVGHDARQMAHICADRWRLDAGRLERAA